MYISPSSDSVCACDIINGADFEITTPYVNRDTIPEADTASALAYTKRASNIKNVADGLLMSRTSMPKNVPHTTEPTVVRKNINTTYATVDELRARRCPARWTRATATASFINDSFSTT